MDKHDNNIRILDSITINLHEEDTPNDLLDTYNDMHLVILMI